MSKVLDGPITIRGDLIVTGRLNKGLDTAQANNGKALQVIQDVLQPVVTQPNVVPASGDVRMYGQNVTINGTPSKCLVQYLSSHASMRSGWPSHSRPNRTCAGPCFSQAGRSSRSASRFTHHGCCKAHTL